MNPTTITQLAAQYHDAADLLRTRIKCLRVRLRTARGAEALELQRRIEVLCQELTDVRVVSAHLQSYYQS